MFIEVNKWDSVFLWVNEHWFAGIVSVLNQTEAVELNHQNFLLKFHLSKSIRLSLEPVADSILGLLNAPQGLGFFFFIMSWDMHVWVFYEQYVFYNKHDWPEQSQVLVEDLQGAVQPPGAADLRSLLCNARRLPCLNPCNLSAFCLVSGQTSRCTVWKYLLTCCFLVRICIGVRLL